MASRKDQKEEARRRRLAEEQARADQARRQRRLQMLGGIVLAAVIVVVVAIVISSSGGSSGLKTGTAATQVSKDVQKLFAGIPQNGATLGNPNAKQTLVYYGDLQCPVCQDFTLKGGFQDLINNEVRQGKVKVVYRAFQTATRDQQTFEKQQVAALSAGAQQHMWDYIELFYRQQGQEGTGYATDAFLTDLAGQIPGLNMSKWKTDRNNPAYVNQVIADAQLGNKAGITGTPTLIAEGPKGKTQLPEAVPSYPNLQQALNSVS